MWEQKGVVSYQKHSAEEGATSIVFLKRGDEGQDGTIAFHSLSRMVVKLSSGDSGTSAPGR